MGSVISWKTRKLVYFGRCQRERERKKNDCEKYRKKILYVLRDKEGKGTLMILILIKTCQVFRP